jgi:hypothetical protein
MNYRNNTHKETHTMTTTGDLPTLPIGTALRSSGFLDREIIRSAPGFALAVDGFDQISMAWVNGAWRARSNAAAWTVKPGPPKFLARRHHGTWWAVETKDECAVILDVEALSGHVDAEDAARAIADLLTDMACDHERGSRIVP